MVQKAFTPVLTHFRETESNSGHRVIMDCVVVPLRALLNPEGMNKKALPDRAGLFLMLIAAGAVGQALFLSTFETAESRREGSPADTAR